MSRGEHSSKNSGGGKQGRSAPGATGALNLTAMTLEQAAKVLATSEVYVQVYGD